MSLKRVSVSLHGNMDSLACIFECHLSTRSLDALSPKSWRPRVTPSMTVTDSPYGNRVEKRQTNPEAPDTASRVAT